MTHEYWTDEHGRIWKKVSLWSDRHTWMHTDDDSHEWWCAGNAGRWQAGCEELGITTKIFGCPYKAMNDAIIIKRQTNSW